MAQCEIHECTASMNSHITAREKVCVALDVDTADRALEIVKELKDYVGMFKVGSQLFTIEGPSIVHRIRDAGSKVFLDLKYHDIPNTVRNTAIAAVSLGTYIFNIHTVGGSMMMKTTACAVADEAKRLNVKKPILLGITVLTSINQESLQKELKIDSDLKSYVVHLARLAKDSGLDGVVASPEEIKEIRNACGNDFCILTPGIRPSWVTKKDDQQRVMTPKDAIAHGANYIVIGRPIIQNEHPVDAAIKILEEINC